MKKILIYARIFVNILRITPGTVRFIITGKNSNYAYFALIRLFTLSNGYLLDWVSRIISVLHPPYKFESAYGVLGDLSTDQVKSIANDLFENGYHVFDQKLSEATCDALMEYALKANYYITIDKQGKTSRDRSLHQYNREAPEGLIYHAPNQDTISEPLIQDLFADQSILSIAQAYLRAQPLLDFPSLWWSTAVADEASTDAAQLYHFDFDRIRWLKFFIYLTDVEEANGPHAFIQGSHRSGNIPEHLMQQGYARLTDQEVEGTYRPEQAVYFIAKRGTIIAEDTRGLHKGAHVRSGDRLILQLQFSNCLFGTERSADKFKSIGSSALQKMIERYPRIYQFFS